MVAEIFHNFGTSQLASSITPTSTSLTVTSGSGSNFPATGPFTVTIDTEIMLIGSRSTDTFTITTRGYDGTTAASHTSSATVQLAMVAYNMAHLWQNVPDAYNPYVSPVQATLSSGGQPTGTANSYDNEFESSGNWTLYPSPASGTTYNAGIAMRSHLYLNRPLGDNTTYTTYASFPVSGGFTLTAKVSDSIDVNSLIYGSHSSYTLTALFVSDATNPTISLDSGNRFRIQVVSAYPLGTRTIQCVKDVSGSSTVLGSPFPLPVCTPIIIRLVSNGSGTWIGQVGDGFTFHQIMFVTGISFTPQTMGVQFYSFNSIAQGVAIDYIRVS